MTNDNDLAAWLRGPAQAFTPVRNAGPVMLKSVNPRYVYVEETPTDEQMLMNGVPVWRVTVTGGIFGDRFINVRIICVDRPDLEPGSYVELKELKAGRKPNREKYLPYFVADAVVPAAPVDISAILGDS